MDTNNDSTMAPEELISRISREKTVVGAKQLRKAVTSGRASRVYLAQNADPAMLAPILAQCKSCKVPCIWVSSMQELGRACGIDVGAAAAAAVHQSDSTG